MATSYSSNSERVQRELSVPLGAGENKRRGEFQTRFGAVGNERFGAQRLHIGRA